MHRTPEAAWVKQRASLRRRKIGRTTAQWTAGQAARDRHSRAPGALWQQLQFVAPGDEGLPPCHRPSSSRRISGRSFERLVDHGLSLFAWRRHPPANDRPAHHLFVHRRRAASAARTRSLTGLVRAADLRRARCQFDARLAPQQRDGSCASQSSRHRPLSCSDKQRLALLIFIVTHGSPCFSLRLVPALTYDSDFTKAVQPPRYNAVSPRPLDTSCG